MKISIHKYNEITEGVYNLGISFRYDKWVKRLDIIISFGIWGRIISILRTISL